MLKLALQYFGHLMQTDDSLEKTLMLGETEGRKEKREAKNETARQHHQLNGHELRETLGDSGGQRTWCAAVHGVTKSRT